MDDRDRWNARYRDGAFAERNYPNRFLAEQAHRLPAGSILDLACGAGRNARFLADQGHDVLAIDVADEALNRVCETEAHAKRIRTERVDLTGDWAPAECFAGIVVLRYLNLSLIERCADWLRPGGVLLCEVHLASDEPDISGPRSARFRARPGDLAKAASSLSIEHSFEGLITDPDDKTAAVARLVARHTDA